MKAAKLVAVALVLLSPLGTAATSPPPMSAATCPTSHEARRDETIEDILSDIKSFQREVACEDPARKFRPFVLASFAQSLDGQMAPWTRDPMTTCHATSSNYPLSGPDSLVLTHALRSIHDGILVGGRTLAIDNPRLTNRLWKVGSDSADLRQPIPIVLDTRLDNVQSMLTTSTTIRARNLVVCCGENGATVSSVGHSNDVRLLHCNVVDNQLDLRDVLYRLRTELDIRALMVEGGASVLSTLFAQGLVDAICVTISPKALCGGIAPLFGSRPVDLTKLDPKFVALGNDCILISRWPADAPLSNT